MECESDWPAERGEEREGCSVGVCVAALLHKGNTLLVNHLADLFSPVFLLVPPVLILSFVLFLLHQQWSLGEREGRETLQLARRERPQEHPARADHGAESAVVEEGSECQSLLFPVVSGEESQGRARRRIEGASEVEESAREDGEVGGGLCG